MYALIEAYTGDRTDVTPYVPSSHPMFRVSLLLRRDLNANYANCANYANYARSTVVLRRVAVGKICQFVRAITF